MKSLINTKQRQHLIDMTLDNEVDKAMVRHQEKVDAMWLVAISRMLGYRAKGLEKVYKTFYEVREENSEFFCQTDEEKYSGVLGVAAVKELETIGVDITELYKKYGEPVITAHAGKEKRGTLEMGKDVNIGANLLIKNMPDDKCVNEEYIIATYDESKNELWFYGADKLDRCVEISNKMSKPGYNKLVLKNPFFGGAK